MHEAGERTCELGGSAHDRGRVAAGTVLQIGRERGGTDQYECGEHVVRLLRSAGPRSRRAANRTGRRRSGPQRWNISPPASCYVLPDIVGTFGNAGEAARNMRTRT